MPTAHVTAHATVTTARPGRYLTQLCRHVDQLSRHTGHRHPPRAADPAHTPPGPDARVTWSDTTGTIDLGWGRCTLKAGDGALVLHAEAHDAADLHRLQALLADRLQQIGRRDQLVVEWEPVTTAEPLPAAGRPPDATGVRRRANHGRVLALVAVGALVVALHLGLGAAVLTSVSWAGPAAEVVLAVVAVKLLVSIVLGRRLVRHRRRLAPTPQEAADEPRA